MKQNWKTELDKALINSDVEAWTSAMLWGQALSSSDAPSRATFDRWVEEAVVGGKLKRIRAGIFLNAMGQKDVSPAAAVGFIRRNAIPSLSWVLEQKWVMNNFGDTITCTVPQQKGMQNPSVGKIVTQHGTFRFHAIPWRLHELAELPTEDWRDSSFAHPRATPEKAFADWLYLASTARSGVTAPPLDMDFDQLEQKRLRRIIQAMGLQEELASWRARKIEFDADEENIESGSKRWRQGRAS
jgi:hypothetical protein